MDGRNYRHIEVQKELAEKGLSPEVRLVECAHLSKDELGEFERLQISYWKNLIGKRLTNIGHGGAGFNINWDKELCERLSKIKQDFFSSNESADTRNKLSQSKKEFYSGLEGEQRRADQGKRKSEFYETEEGFELRKAQSEQQREIKLAYHTTDAGKAAAKNHSNFMINFFQTEEGKVIRERKRAQASDQCKGAGNPAAKMTEETAQAILDTVGGTHTSVARKFGVSRERVSSIRNRKSWRHLTPSRDKAG
jgi:hypothetical protein